MDQSFGTTYKPRLPEFKTDYIARIKNIQGSANLYQEHYVSETVEFVGRLMNVFSENTYLKDIVRNLWKNYQYNQEYISYLLDTRTKEEFLASAEEFAEPYIELNKEQVFFAANLVLNTLNQPLTSAEISLCLNIDPNNVETSNLQLLEYDPNQIESE